MPPEPLEPVYLIWGEDRAMVDRALSRLTARVADEGGLPPDRFSAAETPADEVVAAGLAATLEGSRELSILGVVLGLLLVVVILHLLFRWPRHT
jgi:DNA polymerase III delta subunit